MMCVLDIHIVCIYCVYIYIYKRIHPDNFYCTLEQNIDIGRTHQCQTGFILWHMSIKKNDLLGMIEGTIAMDIHYQPLGTSVG